MMFQDFFFFFKQKTAYEMLSGDWSSDVCSSDLLGQSQAAALEAAGKEGIIYNSTYTNFWEGAMAWSGWWHNQVGLLTEVASARVAAPMEQQRASANRPPSGDGR